MNFSSCCFFSALCLCLQGQREQNKSTIPSTVGEEKRFNPFMRVRYSSSIALFRYLVNVTFLF